MKKPTETIQRFINIANEKGLTDYFEQDLIVQEMEMLAEIGKHTFNDDYIRSCLRCNQLFYAPRIDSLCCSKRCANYIRVYSHQTAKGISTNWDKV